VDSTDIRHQTKLSNVCISGIFLFGLLLIQLVFKITSDFWIRMWDLNMKSSDAKASKCRLKFSSKMTIFIKLVYLSSAISHK